MKTSILRCTTNRSCTNSSKQAGKIRAALPSIAVKSSRREQYIPLASDGKEKKGKLCIQEIKLENNKWLVFNEENEQETVDMSWGSSSLRKKPSNTNNQKKVWGLSIKENTRLITDLQQKKTPNLKLESSFIKKQQKYLIMRASRKVTPAANQENTVRQSATPSPNNFKNHSKSNKSARSMKSASSNHSGNHSKRHQKELVKSDVPIIEQKSQQMLKFNDELKEQHSKDKVMTEEFHTDKRILLATIYDPIQLLNTNLLKSNLCADFYHDFPQWKLAKSEISVKNEYHQQNIPNQLSPQAYISFESIISKPIQQSLQRSQKIEQAPIIVQAPALITQQFPQSIPEKSEQTEQIVQVKATKQCVLTASTQYPQKTQCSNTQLQASPQFGLQKIPQIFNQTRYQSKSFDQLEQLSKFKDVRLIQIDSNQQTALIPSKFTNQYLVTIPSTSILHNQFKNDEILYFINHLIFTNPHLIHNVLLSPNRKGFSCLLFVDGQRKIITVDGLFPFDANYFPLYGYFDQFIWFSVLTKCIAKIYGSYSSINILTYTNIYQMLTGQVLINFDVKINGFKTLKQLKILMKNAQKVKQTLLLTKKQDYFFKIIKIETTKPNQKIKSIHKNQNTNKQNGNCEDSFKSLNFFLKKEIKLCEKNQLHESTFIYLKGFNSKRKMTFKDFLAEGFEVLVSSNILSFLSEAGIQLEGLSSL